MIYHIPPLARIGHESSPRASESFTFCPRLSLALQLCPLMPPPGSIPPGYAYQHIPPSFQMRKVLPPEMDTNGRAYIIFFSYMLLAFSLTVFVILRLFKSYHVLSKSTTTRPPPKEHVQ